MVDVSIIRVRVWKELSWAANFVDNTIVPDLPLLELITMQVYVQPRVVKATEYILESDPEETDEYMPIAAYPFVSDRNAARLDNNPMSPVPREPVNTIVERTGKNLRAVIFDGGSPSPDVSRTLHIPHENISRSSKSNIYLCIGTVMNHKLHQSPLLSLHRQQLKTMHHDAMVQISHRSSSDP